MKDIIEKVGIKPIAIRELKVEGVSITQYSPKGVRKLEQQRDEMLEVLIDDILESENNWLENWLDAPDCDPLTTDEEILKKCDKTNHKTISIIEKATGKTWEEIKMILSKPEPVQLIQKDIIDPKDWDMDADIAPEAE